MEQIKRQGCEIDPSLSVKKGRPQWDIIGTAATFVPVASEIAWAYRGYRMARFARTGYESWRAGRSLRRISSGVRYGAGNTVGLSGTTASGTASISLVTASGGATSSSTGGESVSRAATGRFAYRCLGRAVRGRMNKCLTLATMPTSRWPTSRSASRFLTGSCTTGSFTDADISIGVRDERLALRLLVPNYEESSRERPWWRLRKTVEVPRYEYRVELAHIVGVTIRDESHTYDHKIVRISYDAARDVLVFEAAPTFIIEVGGAAAGDIRTTGREAPVDVLRMKAIGPIEYD